jgi:hypothetical protein
MNESMMSPGAGDQGQSAEDAQLDALFRAYRVACEPKDVSANFMPELWQKIDTVQNAAFSFRRIAKTFVTVAAGLTLILLGFETLPFRQVSPVFSATYVEALADHTDIDATDLVRPEIVDLSEEI